MILNGYRRPMRVDEQGKQLAEHGSALFPIACFQQDITAWPVHWHWHEDWEIIVTASGSMTVSICSKKFTLRPGQGIFINSGVPHELCGEGEIHSAVFHPRLVGGLDSIYWQKYIEPLMKNPNLHSVLLDGSAPWHHEFIDALEMAWQAVADEADCYEFEVRAALSRVVTLLHRRFPSFQSGLSEQELRDMERIKMMLHYIQERFDEELTITKIAESATISKSECLRCFHRTLGITPIQYLKQFRIQRAAELLLSSNKKIVDIAMDCGFSDASYFIRQFRETKGITPKEFQRNVRDVPA